MKKLIAPILVFTAIQCFATDPEDEVMRTVNQLFEGMRLGDSTLVRSAFTKNARMMTVFVKDGEPVLRTGSLDKFVSAVGTPHDKIWDEPIWDFEVRIDGNLAQVWTKYAFYLGNEFSHCGVDAFQLFLNADGWKIFQLTDTRQFENCNPPSR